MLIGYSIPNPDTFPCPFQMSPLIDKNHGHKITENFALIKYQLELHPEYNQQLLLNLSALSISKMRGL